MWLVVFTSIRTIQVTNISGQTVVINVARKIDSLIFDMSGGISIVPFASIEAEDDRFQITQLINLQNKKIISFIKISKLVTIPQPMLTIDEFIVGMALKSNGDLWVWGYGGFGRIGDNNAINRSSPVSVVGNHKFVHINEFSYSNSFGIKEDGSLWGWGRGYAGRVGDNTIINKSSPVSVVGNHSFVEVVSGNARALKTDGSIWAWGSGYAGYNGDNTINNRSSPVSVIGGHSFIHVSGYRHALKSDGSAWGWGWNPQGNLGDNTIDSRSSPVSVVGNHSFIKVVSSFYLGAGLKADGSVWAWGKNQYGQLGQNNVVNRSSPVSVVGNHSFDNITIGYGSIFGHKANDSVWSWGYNGAGNLGDGTTNNRSSPVSVIGGFFTELGKRGYTAKKANGSIWSWGFNGVGWRGDNTIINRSSPVKVIGLTLY